MRLTVWYIPKEWRKDSDPPSTTILEAARLASKRAAELEQTIPHSSIPLIVHQTWMNTKIDEWAPDLVEGVERWLEYAMAEGKGSMAYFLWLDDGCDQLFTSAVPNLVDALNALPLPVERSDVFRIVVANNIGGIVSPPHPPSTQTARLTHPPQYGDIDTHPLRSPATWLEDRDMTPWTDPQTNTEYSPTSGQSLAQSFKSAPEPARLLLGIEADNDPHTDAHWRMGYFFPIQLTQWALAAAPDHPVLNRFIANFKTRVAELSTPFKGNLTATAEAGVLAREDPLKLTGPEAITTATMQQLEEDAGLRWEALTGLQDGGRSKAVGTTVIFPITAFRYVLDFHH